MSSPALGLSTDVLLRLPFSDVPRVLGSRPELESRTDPDSFPFSKDSSVVGSPLP